MARMKGFEFWPRKGRRVREKYHRSAPPVRRDRIFLVENGTGFAKIDFDSHFTIFVIEGFDYFEACRAQRSADCKGFEYSFPFCGPTAERVRVFSHEARKFSYRYARQRRKLEPFRKERRRRESRRNARTCCFSFAEGV